VTYVDSCAKSVVLHLVIKCTVYGSTRADYLFVLLTSWLKATYPWA